MEAGPPQVARDEGPYELPSRRRARTLVRVMLVVVAALVAAAFAKAGWNSRRRDRERAAWGMDQATYERVSTALQFGMPFSQDAAFQGYVDRQLEQKRAQGEKIDRAALEKSLRLSVADRGIPRLGDHDLTDYHALRKRLVFASDRACPCALDAPRCTTAEMMDGFPRLTDEELARWRLLSAKATLLEVQSAGPLPSALPEFQAGLRAIYEILDEASRGRVQQTFQNHKAATKADVCFTIRTLFTGAEKLDEAAYVRFIRALLQVGTQEVLLSDSTRMAERLKAAGVETKLEVWPGMFHAFAAGSDFIPEGRLAMKHSVKFMRQHLGA